MFDRKHLVYNCIGCFDRSYMISSRARAEVRSYWAAGTGSCNPGCQAEVDTMQSTVEFLYITPFVPCRLGRATGAGVAGGGAAGSRARAAAGAGCG